MKLKKWIAATGLALAAMGASATTLDSLTGLLDIKLNGQTTDVAAGSPAGSTTFAGTNETTWGVGSVTSIATSTDTWYAGVSDGYYLYYMLYGIADASTQQISNGYNIYNTGATGGVADGEIHLVLYRSTTKLSTVTNSNTALTTDRTGYSTYSLFAGMEEYLDVVFLAGKSQDNPTTTSYDESTASLVQFANALNLPADGTGSFIAEVVGGTAAAQWNTNSQLNGSDLLGNFTLKQNVTCTTANCFSGLINDPIAAVKNAVPEPTSIALFGIALAGIAGLRRRRNA